MTGYSDIPLIVTLLPVPKSVTVNEDCMDCEQNRNSAVPPKVTSCHARALVSARASIACVSDVGGGGGGKRATDRGHFHRRRNVDRVQPFLLAAAAVVVATVWNSRAETSNIILYYVVYSISRDLKRCGGLKIR